MAENRGLQPTASTNSTPMWKKTLQLYNSPDDVLNTTSRETLSQNHPA